MGNSEKRKRKIGPLSSSQTFLAQSSLEFHSPPQTFACAITTVRLRIIVRVVTIMAYFAVVVGFSSQHREPPVSCPFWSPPPKGAHDRTKRR